MREIKAFIPILSQLSTVQQLVSSPDETKASTAAGPFLCYAIYTAKEAVYSASGSKWSSVRNFKNKASLWKKSPIENLQVVSLLLTEVAGERQCCPTGILLHWEAESTMGQGKMQSKPEVTLRLWWRADSSRVPLLFWFFFARGTFLQFITYFPKPKISLILHSSSWAAKGCVRSHACLFRGFI